MNKEKLITCYEIFKSFHFTTQIYKNRSGHGVDVHICGNHLQLVRVLVTETQTSLQLLSDNIEVQMTSRFKENDVRFSFDFRCNYSHPAFN